MYLLVNISLKGLKTGLLVNMRLIRQVWVLQIGKVVVSKM